LLKPLALLSTLLLAGAAWAGPLDERRQQELETLLTQDCGSCHGLRRSGGLGSPLLPESIAHLDDALVAEIILDGVPDTPMPPWRPLLTEDEVDWLVARLRQGLDDGR
jgi:cytochrome c55X